MFLALSVKVSQIYKMHIEAETETDARGIAIPRRVRMDGRRVDVARMLDQWHGVDYRYFKFMGDDGDLYLLRHDQTSGEWDLRLFEAARAQILSKGLGPKPD